MDRRIELARLLIAWLLVSASSNGVVAQPLKAISEVPSLSTDTGETYSAWLPREIAGHHRDLPLILFSHGFGGCAQQSRTLMRALADAGYVVLAPNHKDKACERYTSGLPGGLAALISGNGPDKSFGDDEHWDDKTEVSRRDDIENLLQFALAHGPYNELIDPTKIGLLGHSLGGYTVLGLSGGWPSWRDARFKAVEVLAPYSAPFRAKQTVNLITIPSLYVAGTADNLIPQEDVAATFALAKSPTLFVVLKGAGHFSYTELDTHYQQTVAELTIAFFDKVFRPGRVDANAGDANAQIETTTTK